MTSKEITDNKILYTYFCHKCHDDFFTHDKEYVEKIRGTRWKCNTCVWATIQKRKTMTITDDLVKAIDALVTHRVNIIINEDNEWFDELLDRKIKMKSEEQ